MTTPAEKRTHKERVAMRAMLRESGLVDKQASNDTCDIWLMRHGYLHQAGYKPPTNRVERLVRFLGVGKDKIAQYEGYSSINED